MADLRSELSCLTSRIAPFPPRQVLSYNTPIGWSESGCRHFEPGSLSWLEEGRVETPISGLWFFRHIDLKEKGYTLKHILDILRHFPSAYSLFTMCGTVSHKDVFM